METKNYYDRLSKGYDIERTRAYFHMINSLELKTLLPLARGKRVLEVGCGTGIILSEVSKVAKQAIGIDISDGMIKFAKAKGLPVQKGDALNMPFKDKTFDLTYSLKVLPHIPNLGKALAEIRRVTRDDGHMVLEFYNPYSIKRLVNLIFAKKVYVRYDCYWNIKSQLPPSLKIVSFKGVRILTPFALFFKVPVISVLLEFLENKLCETILGFLGGYFILVVKRKALR